MSTKTQRTITRDDAPARMPAREPVTAQEGRDPNKIYSRSGREINGLRFTGDEDRFDLARLGVYPPDGWTYEWKTKTIKNWEWHDHQVELYQNGWEPVPAERHDGMIMPKGYQGPIERGGMILMERDARSTALARRIEKRRADEPVHNSRQLAGVAMRNIPGVDPSSADFDHGAARQSSFVRTDRQPRVNDSKYTYEIDE